MAKKKTETEELVIEGSPTVELFEIAQSLNTDKVLIEELTGKIKDLEAQLATAKAKKAAPALTDEQRQALKDLLEGAALVVRNSNNVSFRQRMKAATAVLTKLV